MCVFAVDFCRFKLAQNLSPNAGQSEIIGGVIYESASSKDVVDNKLMFQDTGRSLIYVWPHGRAFFWRLHCLWIL